MSLTAAAVCRPHWSETLAHPLRSFHTVRHLKPVQVVNRASRLLQRLNALPRAGGHLVLRHRGGIQEETTYLGTPCLTVRKNTERPVTVTSGTNVLVGEDMSQLLAEAGRILSGEPRKSSIPPLWDGRAAHRIAEVITAAHIERKAPLAETAVAGK